VFFADQVSQCAEEGAGLGWFECHCWFCGGVVALLECTDIVVEEKDWSVEMMLFGGVEIVVVWERGDCSCCW
jgi:hypothetical protein